ncbi:osmotically inducible protein OsmC [Boudabousia tangfeifanii]|uniref:Osmotically inducible protein OsmC n=1 Tax=Boudabousia tangfeifanii TaxID=1912795 RepID=A0A1D9MMB0_9ACTO|nr:osmotically inducible protein OsmC [Boudabousia tangfeifanii]
MNVDPTAQNGPHDPLWAERIGERQYVARNARGAEVVVGMEEGQFSPGELLKIALATCNSLSADHSLARTFGKDFKATVGVSGDFNKEDDRYESFQVEIVVEDAEVDQEKAETTAHFANRAIDKYCTVGHTLAEGAPYKRALTFEPKEA